MNAAIQEANPYWLLTWLESKRIKTVSEAANALSRRSTIQELREVAQQWTECAQPPPHSLNLVAGSGVRLDDDLLSCPGPVCRRRQVDVLFRHAWHYFDRILLPDGTGSLLLDPPSHWDAQYTKERLLGLVEVALHIQQLGASSLVHYYPSVETPPDNHREASADHWTCGDSAWEQVEDAMAAEVIYRFERIGERKFSVSCSDPFLGITLPQTLELERGEPQGEDHLRRLAAHELMHVHMAGLEEDIATAHRLRGSLASAVWSHERALSAMSQAPDPSSIAFHISFPTLENVPINELIAIRSTNQDAFISFRDAIAKAAKELSAKKGALNRQELANQIRLDVIEPELAKLNQRLRSAKRSLARKVVASIVLSSVGTLCAASIGLFPVAAVGAVGTAAAIANISKDTSKYIDEKREIELADMYFIWKALKHAE